MEEEKLLSQILKRLDALICLELEKPLAEKATSMSERIARLSSLGLLSSEIAGIIGKTINYVTAVQSQKRKASGAKGRTEK